MSVPPPAASPFAAPTCVECGAELSPGSAYCWLCQRPVAIRAELATAAAQPSPVSSFQFSIQTLLLITTLAAVCLGALVTVPGLGILVLVVAIPALVRTCVTGAAMKREGHTFTTTDKIMSFLASAAVAWAALAAAGVAIVATCTATLFAGLAIGEVAGGGAQGGAEFTNFIVGGGIVLCCATGLAAFLGMFWITRPYIPKRS